eukprot:scaffold12949_cov67-Isochrysis_galbana.AAC.2
MSRARRKVAAPTPVSHHRERARSAARHLFELGRLLSACHLRRASRALRLGQPNGGGGFRLRGAAAGKPSRVPVCAGGAAL